MLLGFGFGLLGIFVWCRLVSLLGVVLGYQVLGGGCEGWSMPSYLRLRQAAIFLGGDLQHRLQKVRQATCRDGGGR